MTIGLYSFAAHTTLIPLGIMYIHYLFSLSIFQALYTALHRSREAIIITDDSLRAQYANRASERILNMKLVSITMKLTFFF